MSATKQIPKAEVKTKAVSSGGSSSVSNSSGSNGASKGISKGAVAIFVLGLMAAVVGGQYYLSTLSGPNSTALSVSKPQQIVVFDDIAALTYFVDAVAKADIKSDLSAELKQFEQGVQASLDAYAIQHGVTVLTVRVAIAGGFNITNQIVAPITTQILAPIAQEVTQ